MAPPPKIQKLTTEHLERLNIGRRYWKASIASIPEDQSYRKVLIKYLKEIHKNRQEGWGLWLWGQNSRGKTWAACAVLKEASRQGYSCYCTPTSQLRAAFIENHRFDAFETVAERVQSVDFLLLDDLGKEYSGKGSGWSELMIENLFRERARQLKPILITTNLTREEFESRYKQSALAIALECMLPINVKGGDLRSVLRDRRIARER